MKPGFTYRDKEKRGKAKSTYNNYEESRFYEPSLISIIVHCYNEAGNIEHFLNAISKLDLRPYTIGLKISIIHTEQKDLPGFKKTSIQNNCNQNTACRNINFLMDDNYEKTYHPEAESRHPP